MRENVSRQTYLKEWLFLLLTPLYLGIVFYKLLSGTQVEDILILSSAIFVLYLPIQIVVAENHLPLTFSAVFSHDEVLSLIYPVVGLVLLAGGIMIIERFLPEFKDVAVGIFLLMYALWWYVTNQLLELFKASSVETKIKMSSMLLFIVSLIIISNFPNLPAKVDGWYFVMLAVYMGYVGVLLLALVPKYAFVVLGHVFKSALKRTFSMKRTRSEVVDPSDAVEFSFTLLAGGFILYILAFIPLVSWMSQALNSWDATTLAVMITLTTVVVSLFGAYFQVRLFVSYFVQDNAKVIKATIAVLALFYTGTFLSMGFMDTVDQNTKQVESGQKSLYKLNERLNEEKR